MTNNISITKDLASKKIHVIRDFAAPVDKVWTAWTTSDALDKWWAPRPWRAETKSMDFSEGGSWIYAMVGPDGTRAWCRVYYKKIVPGKSFSVINGFADEQGNPDKTFPQMDWITTFNPTATGTRVVVEITFDTEADLQKIVDMGFEAGFTMGLGNLEELLAA